MRNVKMEVGKDEVLTITVDLKKEGEPSASGKSTVIGTTSGSVPVPGQPDVKVGLNVYQSRRAKP